MRGRITLPLATPEHVVTAARYCLFLRDDRARAEYLARLSVQDRVAVKRLLALWSAQ